MAHKFGLTFATTLVLASASIFGFAFESVAQTSQNVFAFTRGGKASRCAPSASASG